MHFVVLTLKNILNGVTRAIELPLHLWKIQEARQISIHDTRLRQIITVLIWNDPIRSESCLMITIHSNRVLDSRTRIFYTGGIEKN